MPDSTHFTIAPVDTVTIYRLNGEPFCVLGKLPCPAISNTNERKWDYLMPENKFASFVFVATAVLFIAFIIYLAFALWSCPAADYTAPCAAQYESFQGFSSVHGGVPN